MLARRAALLALGTLAWAACKGAPEGGAPPATSASSSASTPGEAAPSATSSAPAATSGAPDAAASASPEVAASAAPVASARGPMTSCKTDDDCVPKTCCHATECTLSDKAPSCEKARCGKKRDKTLDYGGKCVCTDGTCRAFTAKLPRGIRDMGRDPF